MSAEAHKARNVPIENLPFFDALMKVHNGTKQDIETLLPYLAGFSAYPRRAICCSYEWSAFDVFITSVERGHHDWEFFNNTVFVAKPDKFFTRKVSMKCKCGSYHDDIDVLYNYNSHTSWNSDIRLKENLVKIGSTKCGIEIFSFNYIWSSKSYVGAIAQKVAESHPMAVSENTSGYLTVDYSYIDFLPRAASEWERAPDKLLP